MFRKLKIRRLLKDKNFINQLGGSIWDDYDENGIPYWHYFWNNDEKTGDGWRLIPQTYKWEDVRDGMINPEIQKDMK